ncbi:hypothetical protein [Agrobacterium larrymoorei]|uniref:Uncharacterized protein n=1 Tax=Agrobacterium larrymoorei TaxID=160699 RepID=A0AAF0KEG0_9HYPH|nr:hypothetical protein [Agrobacterium larrymoorei]WHA42295.1 hypothetical protein CFBP5477_006645 [Agrobacterium larrymoorei]
MSEIVWLPRERHGLEAIGSTALSDAKVDATCLRRACSERLAQTSVDETLIFGAVTYLANSFIALHEKAPRTAALFASQQRWFLCHAALAQHFGKACEGSPGLTRRSLGKLAVHYQIASRNTAFAFFDEILKYGIIEQTDRRDIAVPSRETLALLKRWYEFHFRALDMMDGGQRCGWFLARSEQLVAKLSPVVGKKLLEQTEVRSPGHYCAIFTDGDAGGLIMDRLAATADWPGTPEQKHYLTEITAIAELARLTGLSRAHTSRKLAASERLGGTGWSGARGRSRLWISREFLIQYAETQLQKLTILNEALEDVGADGGAIKAESGKARIA